MMKRIIYLIATLLILGCSPEKKEEQARIREYDAETMEIFEEIYKIVPIMDPSTRAANFMKSMQAEFDPSMLELDPGRVSKYESNEVATALNLGRLMVDLVYLDVFDQDSLAGAVFEAMQNMADTLGIGRSFNQLMYMRYVEYIDSNDSTRKVIMESIENANTNLRDNNRMRIAALITTGEFFESLFIVTQTIERRIHDQAEDDIELDKLSNSVGELKTRLGLLIQLLSKVQAEGETVEFFDDLIALEDAFREVSDTKGRDYIDTQAFQTVVQLTADVRQQILDTNG